MDGLDGDISSSSNAELQGAFQLIELEVPHPALEGRSLSFEGAVAIIEAFADRHEDVLVHFVGPDDEEVVFKVVDMAILENALAALLRAGSKEEMAVFHRLTTECSPGGLRIGVQLTKDPLTGEVPDPITGGRFLGARVTMVPKN
jgi:hypothetical protein